MIPVLRELVRLAENGNEKATIDHASDVVSPLYIRKFNGTKLIDATDPTQDRPAVLPMLAMHVLNYAPGVFFDTGYEEDKPEIRELALTGARTYLSRMEKIVGQDSIENDLAA